jgi:hypothetical protein
MTKLLKDMTNSELIEHRINQLGFDENEKKVILDCWGTGKVTSLFIMTASQDEINDWYDSLGI